MRSLSSAQAAGRVEDLFSLCCCARLLTFTRRPPFARHPPVQHIFVPGSAVDHPRLWGPNQVLVKFTETEGGGKPTSEVRHTLLFGSGEKRAIQNVSALAEGCLQQSPNRVRLPP